MVAFGEGATTMPEDGHEPLRLGDRLERFPQRHELQFTLTQNCLS
jgi:hypothetical protein